MPDIVFFYLSDYEVLELSESKEHPADILDALDLELRLLVLLIPLDGCVVFPPSHYRESPICQKLVLRNSAFVNEGYLWLMMREATLKENAEKQAERYKNFIHIDKYRLAYLAGTDYGLSTFGFRVMSKGFLTGKKTMDIWEENIRKTGLNRGYPSSWIEELVRRVRDDEETPFIWERVRTVLHSMNFSAREERLLGIRAKISISYLEAHRTGNILLPSGSRVAREVLLPQGRRYNTYDLLRFQRVLQVAGVFRHIASFSPKKILRLKYKIPHVIYEIRSRLRKGFTTEQIIDDLRETKLEDEFQKAVKEIVFGGIEYLKREIFDEIEFKLSPDLEEFLIEKVETIEILARRFIRYEHPEGKIVNAESIRQFLRQFNTVRRASLILILLQNIIFIDREQMAEMFRYYCQNFIPLNERDKIILTNLGGPYDSSHLLSYYLGDVAMEVGIKCSDLRAILDKKTPSEATILFVDDNIASGKQAVDIFRDLLGLIREKELKEMHELELTSEQAENLKKFRIRLFTLIGFEEGKKKFVEVLQRLGLNVEEPYSFLKTEEKVGCFHPALTIFERPKDREECKTMCSEIGYQLFSDKTNWTDELRKERSLGYGNSQKLIVFFYNIPTSTLPILWKRGRYRGREWEPLFLRREKKL